MNSPESSPPPEPREAQPGSEKSTVEAAAESKASAAAESVSLAQQYQQAAAERDTNLQHWQRTQAEFENYRKRSQKEQEQERQYRNLGIARDLLPVLDNLQRALQAAKASHDVDQLLQGVQMVLQQLMDAFGRHSIVPIEAVGKPFDPNLHEAIQQVPSADHEPLTVLQDVEQGYMLHDRVIRPTKVIVSAAPAEAPAAKGGASD